MQDNYFETLAKETGADKRDRAAGSPREQAIAKNNLRRAMVNVSQMIAGALARDLPAHVPAAEQLGDGSFQLDMTFETELGGKVRVSVAGTDPDGVRAFAQAAYSAERTSAALMLAGTMGAYAVATKTPIPVQMADTMEHVTRFAMQGFVRLAIEGNAQKAQGSESPSEAP